MKYRTKETIIYGFGSSIHVSVYPQQKWDLIKKMDGNKVKIERNNVVLILDKDEFEQHWQRIV